jgi:hypothetical protein
MSNRMQVFLVGVVCFLLGCLVTQQLPFARAQEKAKDAKVMHGFSIPVRKSTDADFTNAKKFGVDVYRDENNGNLIYISETGDIAVVPGK